VTTTSSPAAALGSGLSNYDIGYVDGTLSVGQRSADDHRRRPDQDVRRDVSPSWVPSSPRAPVSWVNGDSVTSVSLSSSGAVGTATAVTTTIIASSALGSGLSNYDIGYVDGTLSVGQRTLTITADDQTKTYGEDVHLPG
jgi:hypothetical protein